MFAFITHEAAGASSARHSLRPLNFEGESFLHHSGALRRENAKLRLLAVIARSGATKQSILSSATMDCFAYARNDGLRISCLKIESEICAALGRIGARVRLTSPRVRREVGLSPCRCPSREPRLWFGHGVHRQKAILSTSTHRRGAGRKMYAYATLLLIVVSGTLLPLGGHAEEIDTEHLFGFVIGSDVGETGEREFQNLITGRFAKNTGRYRALADATELEFVPVKNFRVEFAAVAASYDISGVAGFDDLKAFPWTCGTGFWIEVLLPSA
jgi:hypothetical protein